MICRPLCALALTALLTLPAQAHGLSRGDVRKLVTAMEDVADRFGPEALAAPRRARDDATLRAAVRTRGFAPAEWEAGLRRVMRAYEALKANPDLLAELEGEASARAEPPPSGGGPLGALLSADTLSSAGNAALFGGGGLADVGRRAAVDAAATAAGDALGDGTAGAAAVGLGQSAAHGGMDAVKQAGGQLAVDAAANAIAGAVSGDGAAADGREGRAPSAADRADLAAVAPFFGRISAALGE